MFTSRHHHIKFHIPSSNGPYVIPVKLKTEENVRTVAMLFYILQKNIKRFFFW